MGGAGASKLTVGWANLSALVMLAGFAGAFSSHLLSEQRAQTQPAQLPVPPPPATSSHSSEDAPSTAEIARVLSFLERRLGDSSERRLAQPEVSTSPPEPLAPTIETSSLGESAADALARLEEAYLLSLENRPPELPRGSSLEAAPPPPEEEAELAEELLAPAEPDHRAPVEPGERIAFAAETEVADDEEAIASDHTDEERIGSTTSLTWVSSVYAPVYVGADARRPHPRKQASASVPVVPRGAFFGVQVPLNQGTTGGAQVGVSFRAPGGRRAQSPWAPIDMSRHNDPWTHRSHRRP